MKRDCLRVEEAIWKAGRGVELPEDARRHIEGCESCGRALKESRRVAKLLLAADSVPAAPDCRAAVMTRLSGAKTRRRAWSYAWTFAPVAAIVIAVIILVARSPIPPKQTVVKRTIPAPKVEKRVAAAPTREIIAAPRATIPPKQVATADWRQAAPQPVRIAGRKAPARTTAVAAAPTTAPVPAAGGPARVAAEDLQPVVFVSVSRKPSSDSDSYGYVQYDHDTGVTTTCLVKRSGNSVEVRMESAPRETNPTRGGIIDETNRAV